MIRRDSYEKGSSQSKKSAGAYEIVHVFQSLGYGAFVCYLAGKNVRYLYWTKYKEFCRVVGRKRVAAVR